MVCSFQRGFIPQDAEQHLYCVPPPSLKALPVTAPWHTARLHHLPLLQAPCVRLSTLRTDFAHFLVESSTYLAAYLENVAVLALWDI